MFEGQKSLVDQSVAQFYSDANAELTTQASRLQDAIAQLDQANAMLGRTTYPSLEWGPWSTNLKPDEASGRGDGGLTPADTGQRAMFSIVPATPFPNYFNIYVTQKKPPSADITHFILRGTWDFPADIDMNNAHCIEMEARQVLKLDTPALLPLMAVPACQLNFSSGQFKYFTGTAGWKSTGIALPRARSISVVMEAHHDGTQLYYDAFTIGPNRYPMTLTAPLYRKTYTKERLSVSLQLDSHDKPFNVSPSGVSLTVW